MLVSYGVVGCDNCIGDLTDVSTRLDAFYNRIDLMERKRSLTIWTVLQAFGSSEFWFGTPTGQEYLAMAVLGLNHGTTGKFYNLNRCYSSLYSWRDFTTRYHLMAAPDNPLYTLCLDSPRCRSSHFRFLRPHSQFHSDSSSDRQ